MNSDQIDLYLGGDLGIWCLSQVSVDAVNLVITVDVDIANTARDYGFKTILGDANTAVFAPSAVGFSVHYPRILKPELICKYRKVYNLHPGYLPWGRGYYPVFWALWEGTPAGATVHEISRGLDEGPIVAQVRVEYDTHDTFGSLWERVRDVERVLFVDHWQRLVHGEHVPSFPQPEGGTYHRRSEFMELKERADYATMTGEELIRLIHCSTFPGYTGLEVTLGTKRFHLKLEHLE